MERKKSNNRSKTNDDIVPESRSGKTKKRLAVGGGAVVILVILYFLRGQFGLGIGDSNGEDNGKVSVNTSGKKLQDVSTPNNEKTQTDWYHDGVVILRTQKVGYEIDTSSTPDRSRFVAVSVKKLKEIVGAAKGNNQGVKVRIRIAPSSTPKIEEQLETILREINLMKDRDYIFVK